RLSVAQRGRDGGAKVGGAFGQRCEAPIARLPISRRKIEQRLRQAVALEPSGDRIGFKSVGKQVFDSSEPRVGRRPKPIEEFPFVEHHREIGGEFWHGDQSTSGFS